MTYRFCITALGAGLVSLASPALAQDREPVRARTTVRDLNLNTAEGQRSAERRVDRAAKIACDDAGGSDLRGREQRRRCLEEAQASGDAQVAGIDARRRWEEQQRIAAERRAYQRQLAARRTVANRNKGARYRSCTWPARYAYKKRVCVWKYRRR